VKKFCIVLAEYILITYFYINYRNILSLSILSYLRISNFHTELFKDCTEIHRQILDAVERFMVFLSQTIVECGTSNTV
jgi:hypothetical protein